MCEGVIGGPDLQECCHHSLSVCVHVLRGGKKGCPKGGVDERNGVACKRAGGPGTIPWMSSSCRDGLFRSTWIHPRCCRRAVLPGYEVGYKKDDKYYVNNHLMFKILVHESDGRYSRMTTNIDALTDTEVRWGCPLCFLAPAVAATLPGPARGFHCAAGSWEPGGLRPRTPTAEVFLRRNALPRPNIPHPPCRSPLPHWRSLGAASCWA